MNLPGLSCSLVLWVALASSGSLRAQAPVPAQPAPAPTQVAAPTPPKVNPSDQPLPQALTRLADEQLASRTAAMAAITTEQAAHARQQHVRETLLRLIGGLPNERGPLNAKVVTTVEQKGFRIEKLVYDSLPGYHVTANLYLPTTGTGPFPAVVYSAGHGPFGKSEAYGMGANLAHNGIAMLAYDPLGAGERIQALDPATGKSYAGGDEHSQAQIPISLVGDSVARYMVWDAMRGIDYLQTRPEIAHDSIGSYGCSGGGTLSAYLTALDTRVKAGVVACFLTTYHELLPAIGPQDGEQVIPGFIQAGLDFPDLMELAAPRAYAEVATTEDMFPFKGAQAAHDEAARFYGLLHAGDKLQFFTGPGTHGRIQPLMPKIVSFFLHNLAGSDAAPVLEIYGFRAPVDLNVTDTKQVTTALPGRTIYQVNQERAAKLMPKPVEVTDSIHLKTLQGRLMHDLPSATGILPQTSAAVSRVQLLMPTVHDEFGFTKPMPVTYSVVLHSLNGLDLPGLLAKTAARTESHARLILSTEWQDDAHIPLALERLFRESNARGENVLVLHMLPFPDAVEENKPTFGNTLPMTSRALLVGKTFVGMRADDVLAAVQYLASLGATSIDAEASGPVAVALLHAAVLEPSITSLRLNGMLSSYRSVLTAMPHRMVTETVVPGVLLHYDLPDLLIAMGSRPVMLVGPVDGGNQPLSEQGFYAEFGRVLTAQQALHEPALTFVPAGQ